MTDHGTAREEFLLQDLNIADADPDPRTSVSLVADAEKYPAAIARNGGEEGLMLKIDFKAEAIDVIADAGLQVSHAKHGINAAEHSRSFALSLICSH